MEGVEVDTFVRSMEHGFSNLKMIVEKEPLIDRALLLLCMSTAVNCMDWSEPEKTLDACKQSVRSITEFAVPLIDRWSTEGRYVFYGDVEIEQDDWNRMFMESQSIASDLLHAHMEAYGTDTEEKITHAYNETLSSLTYMISAGCARSMKHDDAVEYAVKKMDEAFEFIQNNCQRVEV